MAQLLLLWLEILMTRLMTDRVPLVKKKDKAVM